MFAGHVGLAGGTHSMTIDGAEFWYSASDPGPYAPSSGGTICYVDEGVRHQEGQWPKGGDPFFNTPCYGTG